MWDPAAVLDPVLNRCFLWESSDTDLTSVLAAALEHPRNGAEAR